MDLYNGKLPGLQETLQHLTVERLKDICKYRGMTGISSLRKKELIETLRTELEDPEAMEEFLTERFFGELETLDLLCENAYPVEKLADDMKEDIWDMTLAGYVFVQDDVFYMPREIRSAYEELCASDFKEFFVFAGLLRSYGLAAVNLYGIVETSMLTEIFNRQNGETLSEEQMIQILLPVILLPESIVTWRPGYLYDREIQSDMFPVILESQMEKEYYVPDKEEFLRYADPDYCEDTLQWEAVKSFFVKELEMDPLETEFIVHQLQMLTHVGADLDILMGAMEGLGVEEPNVRQMQRLIHLLTEAWNNTRLIENRGFTSNEMMKHTSGKGRTAKVVDNVIPFPGNKLN